MTDASSEDFHTLVLSPHLDDGVLSCGGQLHRLRDQGERVAVATLFTADVLPEPTPFGLRVFHYMGLDWRTGMEQRRDEDLEACAVLGAEALQFDLGEAINRFLPTNHGEARCPYDSADSLFGTPDERDAAIVSTQLDQILGALPAARHWLVPLGIGGHVDHRLLRAAAEGFVDAADRQSAPTLAYYEDFPYSRKLRNRLRVLGPPWRLRLEPTTVELTSRDLDQKVEAIAAYTSQVQPLFGNRKRLRAAVHRDAKRCGGGERLWSRSSN